MIREKFSKILRVLSAMQTRHIRHKLVSPSRRSRQYDPTGSRGGNKLCMISSLTHMKNNDKFSYHRSGNHEDTKWRRRKEATCTPGGLPMKS